MEHGPPRLEDYLASLTPGPELGAVLGAISPADLCGHDAVSFLQAEYRQLAHQLARTGIAVSHVARCGPDGGQHAQRMSDPDRWSKYEVKASLGLSRVAAEELVTLSWNLVDRVPEVGAAMLAGELDLPRAKVLIGLTYGLADSVQATVLANCLPLAALSGPRWTTGKLADYARRLAIALDPHAQQATYDSAVRSRRVIASRNPDGTSDLSGRQLPPERVAAAAARIDLLAKAAKRDGDPRPIDHLRAEIFLSLTEGTWEGLDDAAILRALRASRPGLEPETPAKALDGIELRVSVATALGVDLDPGELAPYGPVHAEHALAILATLGAAQWRWIVLDDTGHHLCSGLTPIRPGGYPARSADCSSVVDLYLTPRLLAQCAEAAETGEVPDYVETETWIAWRRVLADIAERATEPPPPEDPDRRFAGARLRRRVQHAHGRCIGVGCRAPARSCDLDHRHDHAKGGKTTEENNAPACRGDHMLKTEGGWALRRIENGHRWISRLRHLYDVPDEPLRPVLPRPVADAETRRRPPLPEPDPETDLIGRDWAASGVWQTADLPPF
ncbi:MAG: DUF222 domain-containing protein [Sporichthyaceae bacterium]